MRSISVTLASVVVTALSFTSPASADPVAIDQQNLGVRAGGFGVTGDTSLAQTFTVGLSGVLRELDLMVFFPHEDYSRFTDPLSIELRSAAAGSIGTSILHSIQLAPQELTTDRFALTAFTGLSVNVSAGDVLAIVLSTGANGNFGWGLSCCYAGGGAYSGDGSGEGFQPIGARSTLFAHHDFMFRTWVEGEGEEPAPTPEPGTVILLASGLAGVVAARRRRQC